MRTWSYRSIFLGVLCLISQGAFAEGSYQAGLNQPYQDYASAGAPLYVDVQSAGEVINIAYCGSGNNTTGSTGTGDSITVKIFAPGSDPATASPLATTTSAGNVDCGAALNAPLDPATLFQFDTTTDGAGTYVVTLDNVTKNDIDRLDITVTADATTWPDPTATQGRLWAYNWTFYTGAFTEAVATNADYYALVPGGRVNTNYVWKLDLNNFSGNKYTLVANDLGVNAPNSGYSVPLSGNGVTEKFPLYLNYPTIANPRPTEPPTLTGGLTFIDDAGQDYAISPGSTATFQDSGNFTFTSDVAGTYAITIDTNSDGIYGAGDRLLLGNMVVGLNTVPWDGTGPDGVSILGLGKYRAQLQARLGEYHFIANDAETSGGTLVDGLTIYLANDATTWEDTTVYWDDATFLTGSSNLPDGALASTAAGKHTWGDFTSTSIGNNAYIDTYVYGIASAYTAVAAIVSDDTLQTGVDGAIDSPVNSAPGSSFTITVSDADIDILPGVVESATAVVTNSRTGEQEQVTLTETGVNTGVFSVSFTTAGNAAAGTNNDGTMNVQSGDTLTATYQDQLDSAGASVNFTSDTLIVGAADGTASTVTASPVSIAADGSSTSTITVQLKDAAGTNLTTGGDTVALSSTKGSLGSVTDNGNGSYSATLTSSTTVETATITGTVNAGAISDNATVAFVIGAASGATSTISASPTSIVANGSSTSTITVQLKDATGHNLTAGGDTVALSSTKGTLGSVTDNGNGIYSATLTSSTAIETATITGTVNAGAISDNATVAFVIGAASGATSTISASPTSIVANGSSTSTITVQLKDATGHNLTSGGDTVALSSTKGSLGSVTDNGNGSYSATLTASTTVETATITGTVNAGAISDNATVAFVIGAASGATSTISASPTSIVADGTTTSTITVQLKDATGHNLTAGGDTVALSSTKGSLGSVTDNGNGSYSATLTASTTVETATITGTVNAGAITDNAAVSFTLGAAAGSTSTITASPTSIVANGSSTSTITVQLKDATGHNLTTGGDTVALSSTKGSLGSVTDNGNGSYSATLTASTTVETATITGTVNAGAISDNATVAFVIGAASGATSTISASPTSIVANGSSTSTITVQLKDATGHNLTAGGDTVALSSTKGSLGSVTDNGNGSYSATLTSSTTVETATITGTVNAGAISDNATVDFTLNPAVDDDGDGIPNGDEGVGDSDGDGVPDYLDLDSDNDGIPDADEGNVDSDGDLIPDYLDLDSDNDGLYDLTESGIVDPVSLDADDNGQIDSGVGSNGLADVVETAADSDSINYLIADTDGDGVEDFRDRDADNDGINDVIESGGDDGDNDGRIGTGTPSVDADGIPAGGPLAARDTDDDTIPNFRDLDSDNDGLYDVIEANGPDANGDGMAGDTAPVVVDGNGVPADGNLVPVDTDGDTVEDYLDLDTDNDGIPDVTESGGDDPDGDGIIGSGVPGVDGNGLPDGGPLTPVDTDNDGTDDQRDLDSDDDGLMDIVEGGGTDGDDDGMVDGFSDLDGDGFDDGLSVTPLPLPDTDGDGIPDFQDADDSDNDGIPDSIDLDDDNDGIPDADEGDGLVDTDGDGIPDSRDLDSDNDGIFDLVESGIGAPSVLDADNNGRIDNNGSGDTNGLADSAETSPDSGVINYTLLDTDGDGVKDFRDLDSDNDGILDVLENGGSDPDGNGMIGNGAPPAVNPDGIASGTTGATTDTDNDGTPDYQDLDSDNDGEMDVIEVGGTDVNGDGMVDDFNDPDGDGYDNSPHTTPADNNRDGILDYLEGSGSNVIETGLAGVGGCSVARNAPFDPILPTLFLLSLLFVGRGTVRAVCRGVKNK